MMKDFEIASIIEFDSDNKIEAFEILRKTIVSPRVGNKSNCFYYYHLDTFIGVDINVIHFLLYQHL